MSYNPSEGLWTARDPIGFGGGDLDLYDFVGGNPVNGTDPSGLSLVGGGEPAFFKQLIQSPNISDDQKKILATLRNDPLYLAMINYLTKSKCRFQLEVDSQLRSPESAGKKFPIPGLTIPIPSRNEIKISVNPTFKFPYPGDPNPAELVGVILHELIHATLIAAKDCGGKAGQCPLNNAINDIAHDPRFRNPDNNVRFPIPFPVSGLPGLPQNIRDVLNNDYGPEPSLPSFIGDLNVPGRQLIDTTIKGIIDQTGIGRPVVTVVPR